MPLSRLSCIDLECICMVVHRALALERSLDYYAACVSRRSEHHREISLEDL